MCISRTLKIRCAPQASCFVFRRSNGEILCAQENFSFGLLHVSMRRKLLCGMKEMKVQMSALLCQQCGSQDFGFKQLQRLCTSIIYFISEYPSKNRGSDQSRIITRAAQSVEITLRCAETLYPRSQRVQLNAKISTKGLLRINSPRPGLRRPFALADIRQSTHPCSSQLRRIKR